MVLFFFYDFDMVLIWFRYGWVYDFDMVLIWFWYGWILMLWLCCRTLVFCMTPTTTIPKNLPTIPVVTLKMLLGPSLLQWQCAMQHWRSTIVNVFPLWQSILEYGQLWFVILSLSRAFKKNDITVSDSVFLFCVRLASCPKQHRDWLWLRYDELQGLSQWSILLQTTLHQTPWAWVYGTFCWQFWPGFEINTVNMWLFGWTTDQSTVQNPICA